MAENTLNVLLIEDNPGDARLFREYLSHAGAFALEWADSLGKGIELLSQREFDVIVLDLTLPDSRGFETFTRLRERSGATPMVVLSCIDDEMLACQAVREGAQDYLVKGQVNGAALVRAIRYAIERQKTQASLPTPGAQKRARILGFLGGKGGAGTTSVALNVASVWARNGHSVILGEIRSSAGTLSQQVGASPGANLSGLLDLKPEDITDREVMARLCKLPSGLRVLFGPQRPDEYREIGPDHVRAILGSFARNAEFVVLDLPAGHSESVRTAVQSCDFTVVVLEPDPVSTVAASTASDFLEFCGLGRRIIGAVAVNRTPLANVVTVSELKARLPCALVGIVPPAAEAFVAAQKASMPVVLSRPDSNCALALADLASRLATDPVAPLDV